MGKDKDKKKDKKKDKEKKKKCACKGGDFACKGCKKGEKKLSKK